MPGNSNLLLQCWTFGKCELFHWIDVLDLCDEVLEAAASKVSNTDSGRDDIILRNLRQYECFLIGDYQNCSWGMIFY